MYTIKLKKNDFELLKTLPDAVKICRNICVDKEEITFQIPKDNYADVRVEIEAEVAEEGMDDKQEWLNDYGKKLTGLYDEILYQTKNQ